MILSVRDLSFAYRKTPVLDRITFTADAGELLAILGPNGVGKTTLFRCILGEQKRCTGAIELDGTDARTLSARETARRIAYIPQAHPAAFPFPVFDTVLMGTTHRISPLSSPRAAETAIAEEAMRKLGIEALADKDFSRISGGEQQLVYIARALAQQAKILLMDEPTSSLDYGNQLSVLSVVGQLARDGYTVLLSTHNPQHALWFADGILALKNGGVAAFGKTREQLQPELLQTLYGTDVRLLQTDGGPVILPITKREEIK
ncbi:MAG: ABC transporter ATP-binding protein [Clostridia bacterium]|nr:ABC transporter ATP-binding protein [Clostridia bacterium]